MNLSVLIGGIKLVVNTVSSVGITTLCSTAAGELAAKTGASTAKKVMMGVGGAVIGAMVSDAAENYISRQFDGLIEAATTAAEAANAEES